MNILAIGNSFSQDATRYLHKIAESEGENMCVVNLYIGGCALYRHFSNLVHDSRSYSYEFNGESTGIYVSIKQALRSRKWDVITLQQVSHRSPFAESYQPYLDVLAAACREICPGAKLYIHQTWAYEDASKRLEDLGFKTSVEMFDKVKASYDKAASDIGADGIIPSGYMMQSLLNKGVKMHRDTFHANYGYGRYALGLTWFAALTGKDVTKNKFEALDEPADKKMLALVRAAASDAAKEYAKR